MPVTKETKMLGINDLKIAKITADTTTSITFGTLVDIPGIQTLSLTPSFIEKDLRGDEAVLDRYTKLDYISWTINNALMSLDALAIFFGGTITTSGTGATEKNVFTVLSTDIPQYFKLEGQTKYTDAGDVHIVLFKCKASKVDYELKGEDYAMVSASGIAIPTINNGKVKEITFNATATPIA